MFEKFARTNPKPSPVNEMGHRCLDCLRGSDPDKRDCAMRHLLAEGYSAQRIAALRGQNALPQ